MTGTDRTGGTAASLATNAPEISEHPRFLPTGNLWVSLSEISEEDGSVHSLGALVERALGLVEARGRSRRRRLIQPVLVVDGETVPLRALQWQREGHWLPHFTCACPSGVLEGWYCPPVDERGVVMRLAYTGQAGGPAEVVLGWSGRWGASSLTHLRAKPIQGEVRADDDPWTGSRVVSLTAGLPLLAIAWRGGDGVELATGSPTPRWAALRKEPVAPGATLTCDLYIGVATERDGAATTSLHLRRRGFDALWDSTVAWLSDHALPVGDTRPELDDRINTNLFFNYFFAQGNCLDTGAPVMVTSRSPHYYVSAAFWSRDAYCWSFPALLLTDPARAREVLVASLAAAGPRVAGHALYLNGTSLYPGFELDQAAAPILAVGRYVLATGDRSVLDERAVLAALGRFGPMVEPWRHPDCDLYGTFLLPTDDPTDFPYVTTGNALVAAAFDALAGLTEQMEGDRGGPGGGFAAQQMAADHRRHAAAIRAAMAERLIIHGPQGDSWAWACDAEGNLEQRDEPPLSLRTLPYWGVGSVGDPVQQATRAWLHDVNRYHYEGRFAGAGAPHFPFPSGFDLANRLLDHDACDGDPLEQLIATPMDRGLACESWDADTGIVRTGAAMASMAGLLSWAAWEHLTGRRRWDEPPGVPPSLP